MSDDPLPLKPQDLFVLIVLHDGVRHGYGIMKDVERQSQGAVRLEIGSLYRLIARMIDTGLVEDVPTPPRDADADRRRYYRITRLGRRVLRQELQRLQGVVALARTKRLLAEVEGGP